MMRTIFFVTLLLVCVNQALTVNFGVRIPNIWANKSYRATNICSYRPLKVSEFRGGYALSASSISDIVMKSPESYFKSILYSLAMVALALKAKAFLNAMSKTVVSDVPPAVRQLQFQYVRVSYLLDIADWLQGPYFHEVYRSKVINGQQVSLKLVSRLFLVGFATTGLMGPFAGRFIDTFGRQKGTLLFTLFYGFAGLSTVSTNLLILILGRIAGGLGTSLYFSAPEAWLMAEHANRGFDPIHISQTFEYAYLGDAVAAIVSGQLASVAADWMGPTGPFLLSAAFLATAAAMILRYWPENTARSKPTVGGTDSQAGDGTMISANSTAAATISDAVRIMLGDRRILLLGVIQSCFEGAMYMFVLQWAPLVTSAIEHLVRSRGVWSTTLGALVTSGAAGVGGDISSEVPFGLIFSCLMTACFIGSAAFGRLQSSSSLSVEGSTGAMLVLATLSLALASVTSSQSLSLLTGAFLLFEWCVGFYFPSISVLRSRYLPDSHRSIIMNLYGIPLNLIVVGVFLSIDRLGNRGALTCATAVMGLAAVAGLLFNADHRILEANKRQF